MAKNTNVNWRKKMIYQIFPRQYSDESNFEAIIKDLPRIKALGTNIIYIMPIHVIGKEDRKGSVGSPYSVYDYYSINPEYGTLEDFKRLVNRAHEKDMLVMMDIVINHSSRDSVLIKKHPEWYFRNEEGILFNKISDWSDVADLDFSKREVWDYFIEVLVYWADIVDAFRCDVAPLIPLEFWKEAKHAVQKVNPNLFWVSESLHPSFIEHVKKLGFNAHSDLEMYEVFDACYDYDVDEYFRSYLNSDSTIEKWLKEVEKQEAIYPDNYIKIRYLENHDQNRIASYINDVNQIINLTALSFFLRGTPFVYAGQEYLNNEKPDLFEYDPIDYDTGFNISPLIARLASINEDDLITSGNIHFLNVKDNVVIKYEDGIDAIIGYFKLGNDTIIESYLKDGVYENLIDESHIVVKEGKINIEVDPIIIKVGIEAIR